MFGTLTWRAYRRAFEEHVHAELEAGNVLARESLL